MTTRRDRQSIPLSEIRQGEVDKYLMVLSRTRRISKEANSETERRAVDARAEGAGHGGEDGNRVPAFSREMS